MDLVRKTDASMKKSNRAKADLFELEVAKKLSFFFKTDDNFENEIAALKKQIIISFTDGKLRITEQLERAKKTSKYLYKWLLKEKIGKVRKITWVGRDKKSISDVDLELNDQIIGISLKSVGQGTGTQKNIGFKTIKRFLHIDIDNMLDDMWGEIRKDIEKQKIIENVCDLKNTEIKKRKYSYPIITKIANNYGLVVQKKALNQSINNFNHLIDEDKSLFLRYIFGLEDRNKIIDVISNNKHIDIFWNNKYIEYLEGKNLKAERVGEKSYKIIFGNKDLIRIQVSFTNGIGLSPFCQRAFLMF